jgi:hypothetical protein
MKYRRRVFFTDKQKSEIWDRWQRGESMSSIGRVFDRGVIINLPASCAHGRHPSTRSRTVSPRAYLDRSGRDIQRSAGTDVLAVYRSKLEAISLHNQP